MKKRLLFLLLAAMLVVSLAACGKKQEEEEVIEEVVEEVEEAIEDTVTIEETVEVEEEEYVEGMYRSELTNEWIDEELQDQRPIAVMVDNEKTALSHYGTSQADIVYEMMNSTMNGRITRLMCIFKDYNSVSQIGSIRSVRTTNLQIAPEYDAIVVHDGGPFYIDAFLSNPYLDHLSGGFARISNGKSYEFTEYVTTGEIDSRISAAGISKTYTGYYPGKHFTFASTSHPTDLSGESDSVSATKIELPFDHNSSMLEYIEETNTYRYSEYGGEYIDALTGDYMEFTNVFIQECDFVQYDDNGYMNFLVTTSSVHNGYYITGGEAIPVTWTKSSELDITRYYDADGNEVVINTGKTYIAIVPTDKWSELVIK